VTKLLYELFGYGSNFKMSSDSNLGTKPFMVNGSDNA
jgi:hypothetical protein